MEELDELRESIEEQIRLKDPVGLRKTEIELNTLYRRIVWEKPSYWAWRFCNLESKLARMMDRTRAESLIISGRKALAENHLQGLRDACLQLSRLLPVDAEEEVHRGWDAGIS
jgi:hypothetical protein